MTRERPTFAERLRSARELRGMSQVELQRLTEMSLRLIRALEEGRSVPTAERLIRLSDALCIPTDYLLGIALEPGEYVLTKEEAADIVNSVRDAQFDLDELVRRLDNVLPFSTGIELEEACP